MSSLTAFFNCKENANDTIDNSSELSGSYFMSDSNIFNAARNQLSVTKGGSYRSVRSDNQNSILDNFGDIGQDGGLSLTPFRRNQKKLMSSDNNFTGNGLVSDQFNRNPEVNGRVIAYKQPVGQDYTKKGDILRQSDTQFLKKSREGVGFEFDNNGILSGFRIKEQAYEDSRGSLGNNQRKVIREGVRKTSQQYVEGGFN